MEVNLYGGWRMIQAFLPLLRRSPRPRIVNLSSGADSHADSAFGLTARGGAAATYGISKAALNALTSSLAAELADTPVLVNAVCPGLTATYPGAEAMGARPVQQSAERRPGPGRGDLSDVSQDERIGVLDIARGIAILETLVTNVWIFTDVSLGATARARLIRVPAAMPLCDETLDAVRLPASSG